MRRSNLISYATARKSARWDAASAFGPPSLNTDQPRCMEMGYVLSEFRIGAILEPMPINLSIKNAPDEVVQRLRQRAERHHRSLQGELLAIIEEAVRPERALSPGELLAEVRRLDIRTPADSAAIIRTDRDRG